MPDYKRLHDDLMEELLEARKHGYSLPLRFTFLLDEYEANKNKPLPKPVEEDR